LAVFHILTKLNYLSTLYVGTTVGYYGGQGGQPLHLICKARNVGEKLAESEALFAHPGQKSCRRPCFHRQITDTDNVWPCLRRLPRWLLPTPSRRSTVFEHFVSGTPSAGHWTCYISAAAKNPL